MVSHLSDHRPDQSTCKENFTINQNGPAESVYFYMKAFMGF